MTGNKSGCIEVLSAGEVEVGMYVVAYECTETIRATNGSLFNPTPTEEYVTRNINPWFKGIPYEITGRAGPIIAFKTHKSQGAPPICFMDTRLVKLMQVTKEYHDSYWEHMVETKQTVQATKVAYQEF